MLIDTTLREGEQLFGVYFTPNDRMSIVEGLCALGVEEIELGYAAQEDLGVILPWAGEHTAGTRLSVWSPCSMPQVELAASLGAKAVNIGFPASELHMRRRLGLDREAGRALLARTLRGARELGFDYVSVGLEDASRADLGEALALGRLAEEHGADRVRLSDTVGVLTPSLTRSMVETFRKDLGCHLAVHCHNDFGMATANALTALESGADYADVSVLGIGERAGISALEEVAGFLALARRSDRYDLEGIAGLCALVAEKAAIAVPRTKPVAGRDIFACETGIHVHGALRDPTLFEPFDPCAIGAERRMAIGRKSGRAAVRAALEILDLRPRRDLGDVVSAIRAASISKGRPLTGEEIRSIAM
jgi:homocitrate synthase NifV